MTHTNYKEASANINFSELPAALQASHQYTVKYLHLYDKSERIKHVIDLHISKMQPYIVKNLRTKPNKALSSLKKRKADRTKPKRELSILKRQCPPKDENGERRIDTEGLKMLSQCIASLPTTHSLNTNEDGSYTQKRVILHNRIINKFKRGKPCVTQQSPICILTGGPPGSGKSTFLKQFAPWITGGTLLHIDADEVRAKLPEYKGWNADITQKETSHIVNRIIDEVGKPCKTDVVYDGTMNKAKNYLPLIDNLHKMGYKVLVVYIQVPKEMSVSRAMARYKKSGRYVPLEVINEVYDRGLDAFEQVINKADGYIRVDNSGAEGVIVDQGGITIPNERNYKFERNTNIPYVSEIEAKEAGKEVISSIAKGKKLNSERKPSSQKRDNARTSKRVKAPTEQNIEQWKKDPGAMDIAGVDAPIEAPVTVHVKRDKSFIAFLRDWVG